MVTTEISRVIVPHHVPLRPIVEERFVSRFLVCIDLLLILLSSISIWHWRFAELRFLNHLIFLLVYSILFVSIAHTRHLYVRPWIRPPVQETKEVLRSVTVAGLVLGSVIFASGAHTISRSVVGATVLSSTAALVCWRLLLRNFAICGVTERRNVAIVGAGRVGFALQQYFEAHPQFGYDVVGFLDRRLKGRYTEPIDANDDVLLLGTIAELPQLVKVHFIDEILVTLPSDRDLVKDVAMYARNAGVSLRIVPDLYDGLAYGAPIEFVGQFPTISIHQRSFPALQLLLKRVLDVVTSSVGLIPLSPLFLIIALVIKIESKGSVFYRSVRVGKKGKTFICYKFRTMVADAEKRKESLAHLNERDGVLFKIRNDPRTTKVGRFLRKYSLDELPQLWNVLKGDMSLVGPRPPVPGEYTQYAVDHLRRLDVVPGITGLWQVQARQSPSFDDYINRDLEYVERWGLWLDLKILARTVVVVFAGTGQ